tara:strand:+ start:595 stop:840 length:246 start_codon:yes stop_codon:yes gene_type:complete
MAKYDDPDALDKTLFKHTKLLGSIERRMQDKIKTVTHHPNEKNMKRNEIQIFEDTESDGCKIFFRNSNGKLFSTTLTTSED